GFEKIYSTDDETGIVTGTRYHQNFPFIGNPKKTVVGYSKSDVDSALSFTYLPNACELPTTKPISATTTAWELHQVSNGRTNFPYLRYSIAARHKGGIEHCKTTEQSVDDYNNVLTVSESLREIRDGAVYHTQQRTTTNTYGAEDVTNWILGRLTNTSVTTSRPEKNQTDVPAITRKSSFAYNSDGLLIREVLNPNSSDNNLKLTTAYKYDDKGYGVKVKSTQCSGHIAEENCGISTALDSENPYHINRSTKTVWDTRGRFVNETYNSLDQKILDVTSRHLTGQPTQIVDLDGVTIDKAYDAHGRLYFERASTGSWKKTTQSKNTPTVSNPHVLVVVTTGSGIPESSEYFDLLGRSVKTETKSFDGTSNIATHRKYDSRGLVHSESNPIFSGGQPTNWTTYQYDDFGRITLTTYPSNLTSGVNYTNENAVVTTNQTGQTQTEERNALGELLGTYKNGNSGLKTTYEYDALGKLTKTIDMDQITTAVVGYDILGRKISMDDRDTGSWTYGYNALGELTTQTDAKLQTTSFYYDQLGRMTRRTEAGGSASDTYWYYEQYTGTYPGSGASYPGKLVYEIDAVSGFAKSYEYDGFGRTSSITTQIPSTGIQGQAGYVSAKSYTESVTYDKFGRVFQKFDASGNESGTRFVYNDFGYLEQVRDTRHFEGNFYYKVKEMDTFGNVSKIESGNGIESTRVHDNVTGLLKTITTGSAGEVQSLEYNFNAIGRLEWRKSETPEGGLIQETFGYNNTDGLNRLESVTYSDSSIEPLNIQYDNNGNIKNKSDVSLSDYSYSSNHASCSSTPNTLHAVKQIGTKYFCYDNNGNQTKTIETSSGTSVVERSVAYNQFNKPIEIVNSKNGHSTQFQYGTDRSRYVRVDSSISKTDVTHYIGGVEVHYRSNGEVEFKRSIAGRATVSVKGNAVDLKYLHKDYQGTITAITDKSASRKLFKE
ncbi:MAG: hypothetical protein OQJ89_07345, partial [Kangiellaceae bacterium]|nr:hypothetical protein [Kangiellaceae bacterium]